MKKKTIKTLLSVLAVLSLTVVTARAGSGEKKEAKMIANGSTVSIEYTLYLDDGTVVDTNVGKEPLVYEQGAHMIIPGLETRLEGMKAGETKKVQVPPDEAYGTVDKDAFREVPIERIPEEARKVGAMLQATAEDGSAIPLRVSEVRGNTVILDFNHPLAGKTLTFDVKVLDVK